MLWLRSPAVAAGKVPEGVWEQEGAASVPDWGEPRAAPLCANTGAGGVCPVASRAPSPWALCRGCHCSSASSRDRAAPGDARGNPGLELSLLLPIRNTLFAPGAVSPGPSFPWASGLGAPWGLLGRQSPSALTNPRRSDCSLSREVSGCGSVLRVGMEEQEWRGLGKVAEAPGVKSCVQHG